MSEPPAEVLEAAPPRRWPPRRVAWVAVVALGLGGTAYALDHRVRADEERALTACGERAAAAVETAYAPIRERWGRALPALDGGASLMVRFSLYGQVREAAAGASELLDGARRECAGVEILAWHRAQEKRRAGCVRLLGDHEEFLARVERSGVAVNSAWPEPLTGC